MFDGALLFVRGLCYNASSDATRLTDRGATLRVTNEGNVEIAKGRHYHGWALMPTADTFGAHADFKVVRSLHFVAAMWPHKDRSTALRHAKVLDDGYYGRGGYMARECIGGVGCPLLWHMAAERGEVEKLEELEGKRG